MEPSMTQEAIALSQESIAKTYGETLALAKRAQAWFAGRGSAARAAMSEAEQTAYAAETLRLSSRILHVMAWTMNRRAVAAGEISEEEAQEPQRRLGGRTVCLGEPAAPVALLPEPVREMYEESGRLYRRALRLQDMLDAGAPGRGAAPVHALWRRLDELEG